MLYLKPTPDISIIVPVYNESGNIQKLYAQLTAVLSGLPYSHEILFVDDGSDDDSFLLMKEIAAKDSGFRGLKFSRNFGHQQAITAGLKHTAGSAVIMMDGDMQHPPALIPGLIEKWKEGFEIVNTIRKDNARISLFKKLSSGLFYVIINKLSTHRIEPASADFRLMDRKVVDAFLGLEEKERFIRGLVNWVGFRSTAIVYESGDRLAGESKYTFRKMLKFALTAVTSFSVKPLRISFYLGTLIAGLGFLYGVYAIYMAVIGAAVPGWTSILISVLFLGGVQLISIGLLGEYIGRIFNEVKNRPLYLITEDTRQS